MAWYVYKCNSQNDSHQNHFGEWRDCFDRFFDGGPGRWGTPDIVPALDKLGKKDMVILRKKSRRSFLRAAAVALRRCLRIYFLVA